MAKLTPEQQRRLDELTALRDAPDDDDIEELTVDDGERKITIRGKRATSILDQLESDIGLGEDARRGVKEIKVTKDSGKSGNNKTSSGRKRSESIVSKYFG